MAGWRGCCQPGADVRRRSREPDGHHERRESLRDPACGGTHATVLAAAATAGLALATVPGLAASAALAAPPRPSISSVPFSGTHGPGVASPVITISGSHFGTSAPAGPRTTPPAAGLTPPNGDVYGGKLYFTDDANFEAGYSNSGGADCIGIIVVSWSSSKVVVKFGNAYGSFAHWYLTNGDGYALSVKTAIWGGAVSGLT